MNGGLPPSANNMFSTVTKLSNRVLTHASKQVWKAALEHNTKYSLDTVVVNTGWLSKTGRFSPVATNYTFQYKSLHTTAWYWQQQQQHENPASQSEQITPYQPVAENLDKTSKEYPWKWRSFLPEHCYKPNLQVNLTRHHEPIDFRDKIALGVVRFLRVFADAFFQKRYGHRAVVLETVAAVPGMVGGMLQHLQSLRRFQPSGGWIRVLLEEAENERMHLMTFMTIAKPTLLERALVLLTQGGFFAFYALIYIISPKTAHRIVGYLEEEAIISYTQYLQEIDKGTHANIPAPEIAIDYWQLDKNARLRDVVLAVRADEAHHRDVNHLKANLLYKKKYAEPAPVEALRHGDVNPESAFREGNKST